MNFIKKWWNSLGDRPGIPIDTPYTYVYTLGDLALPQPWRRGDTEGVYFLPSLFVLKFADRERLALLTATERDRLATLSESLLSDGITTPLEMWFDPNGKLRLQEGYHRMCIVRDNLDVFPRVPVKLRYSSGTIKSYGRTITAEFESILEILEKKI